MDLCDGPFILCTPKRNPAWPGEGKKEGREGCGVGGAAALGQLLLGHRHLYSVFLNIPALELTQSGVSARQEIQTRVRTGA